MVLVSIQRIGHADLLLNMELMAILFSVLRLLYCALSIVSPVESESYRCLSGLSLSAVPKRRPSVALGSRLSLLTDYGQLLNLTPESKAAVNFRLDALYQFLRSLPAGPLLIQFQGRFELNLDFRHSIPTSSSDYTGSH